MNYHIDHHTFPMVSYRAPPHKLIAEGSVVIYPAVRNRSFDPEYELRKEPPPTARPNRDEFHNFFISRQNDLPCAKNPQ